MGISTPLWCQPGLTMPVFPKRQAGQNYWITPWKHQQNTGSPKKPIYQGTTVEPPTMERLTRLPNDITAKTPLKHHPTQTTNLPVSPLSYSHDLTMIYSQVPSKPACFCALFYPADPLLRVFKFISRLVLRNYQIYSSGLRELYKPSGFTQLSFLQALFFAEFISHLVLHNYHVYSSVLRILYKPSGFAHLSYLQLCFALLQLHKLSVLRNFYPQRLHFAQN